MPPRSMDSQGNISGLHHRPSAKQLITRYESLDTPTKVPAAVEPTLKKERSPIRQSFRNLVGILKKGQSKLKLATERRRASVMHLSVNKSAASSATSLNTNVAEFEPEPEPEPELGGGFSGNLLYLSRLSGSGLSSPLLPVWTSCTATLSNDQLRLSWPGNLDCHYISLSNCSDVRSLTVKSLEPEEQALLPSTLDTAEPKVFQIAFGDDYKERFAAPSVRERAKWVSNIWEAVLSSSQARPALELTADPSSTSSKFIDRSLPPIPVASPPPPTPPTKPTLSINTNLDALSGCSSISHYMKLQPASSPSKSPSIANLSQKSVVKQRLAQIEDWSSAPSPSARTATPPHEVTPRVIAPLVRQNSNIEDSILDSYRDPSSPLKRRTSQTHGSIVPLIQFFQEQSAKQYNQGVAISDQITSLQRQVQSLPIPDDNKENQRLLSNVHGAVIAVEQRMQATDATLKSVNAKIEQVAHNLKNPSPSSGSDNTLLLQDVRDVKEALNTELPIIKRKITELVENGQASTLNNVSTSVNKTDDEVNSKVSEILNVLKSDSNVHSVLLQQQADSARYLNELNNWLETFVNHGTSQIQTMAGSVDRMCTELGCGPSDGGKPSVLAELKSIAEDIKSRDQSNTDLHHAINNLCANLGSEASHNVAALVERQRVEQEGLLRAVAAELSNEIRGERLRFIEAMKEATSMNVQIHVEEFKKELKREVQRMTHEVGRLYRERQTMENQIAELFSFYSKHTKKVGAAAVGGPATVTQPRFGDFQYQSSNSSDPRGRPLPNPHTKMCH